MRRCTESVYLSTWCTENMSRYILLLTEYMVLPSPGATRLNPTSMLFSKSTLGHRGERQVNKNANMVGYVCLIEECTSYRER